MPFSCFADGSHFSDPSIHTEEEEEDTGIQSSEYVRQPGMSLENLMYRSEAISIHYQVKNIDASLESINCIELYAE